MNISRSLLYLLLLYAVLDKDKRLSTTTGLVIAFVILLFNCYYSRCCNDNRSTVVSSTDNTFNVLNGF